MNRLVALLVCALVVAPFAAAQTQPAPAKTPTTTPAKPVAAAAKPATKQRKICKREGATESRLGGTRVCLTAEEWALRKKSEG